MSGGGLSSARLGRLHDVLGGHTESGGVPGLVWLVARTERCTPASPADFRPEAATRSGRTPSSGSRQ